MENKVIAICNGGSEIGPRALGHRSIIARADSIEIKNKVSISIKKREAYRPIAPILYKEAAIHVLEPLAHRSSLSKWMLGAWHVVPDWREAFQGVLHVDNTIRAQIVHNESQWMYQLLRELWLRYRIPALINTSFNIAGEPIVHNHADAISKAQAMSYLDPISNKRQGIDIVVVQGIPHHIIE